MATALRRVVVVGGSGSLGKFIVKELRKDPSFHTSIVTRTSSTATFDGPEKVIRVPDDYSDQDALTGAFKDQDAVVICVNFGRENHQPKIIDAAVKAGVKRVIPSDFSGDAESDAATDILPPLAEKAKVVSYLRQQEEKGLTWTAIITGLFIDFAIQYGLMGHQILSKEATIWDDGNKRLSCSTRSHIAAAVAAVLRQPEKTENTYIYTSSFEVTSNEILQSLEKQTGGSKWAVTTVDSDEMIRQGHEGMSRGDFMSIGKLALGCCFSPKVKNDFVADGRSWNTKLGLQQENLDEVLGQLIADASGK